MKTNRGATIAFWVIALVILGGVAFLWISSGRRVPHGSHRARCMMNVRIVQQAVREYQNAEDVEVGSRVSIGCLIEAGYLDSVRTCPDDHPYRCEEVVPEIGQLFLRCPDPDHADFDHAHW